MMNPNKSNEFCNRINKALGVGEARWRELRELYKEHAFHADSRGKAICSSILDHIDREPTADVYPAVPFDDTGLHYTVNGVIDWGDDDTVYFVRLKGVE